MITRFEKSLGVRAIPEAFEEIYRQTVAEFEQNGTFFLGEQYLAEVQARCNAFPRVADDLVAHAAALRADGEAALYALFVCRAMENRALFTEHLASFDFPQNHEFLAFFALIPAIVRTWEFLTAKGLSQDVIAQTVGQYEECLFVYRERFDRLGMNKRYFDHLQGYVDNLFLNVGRLRYEILKNHELYILQNKKTQERVVFLADAEINEQGLLQGTPPVAAQAGTRVRFCECEDSFKGYPISPRGRCSLVSECYPKAEYELVLRPGDGCLSVHIPGNGVLNEQLCRESYDRARELFAKHYPEVEVKAFHCHSWMMAPELDTLLAPTSNLLSFQRPYLKFPVETAGEDVLNFVFKLRFKTYADLAEDTSLQRALKKLYLNGEYLYEYGGIIPV